MNKHFVCPACGVMLAEPGNCATQGCHLNGMPMEECTCTDNKHSIILNENA